MKKLSKNVIPVLLGGDLNAYSVALAFREAYGVKSHAFVRYKCGATQNSSFIKTHVCTDIADAKVAVSVLLKFAAENTGAELFLIPCSDPYVELLQRIRGSLGGIYRIDMPSVDLWEKLTDKSDFYSLMSRAGIRYPESISFSRGEEEDCAKLSCMEYPAVLKPSDSAEYWKNPFSDMRKVYFPESVDDAKKIMKRIFESGYSKKVILQKKIGDKGKNEVLTVYSSKCGRVVRAVLGEVVLEECGKTSFGNHSAIITKPLDKTAFDMIDFLNGVGYCGFANIDIMTDGKEKYILELNARQGRSCDYLRAAGVNIAELLVKNASTEALSPDFHYKEIYWHYPPHEVVARYSSNDDRKRVEELRLLGREFSPYKNGFEGIRGRIYAKIHGLRLSKSIEKSMLDWR